MKLQLLLISLLFSSINVLGQSGHSFDFGANFPFFSNLYGKIALTQNYTDNSRVEKEINFQVASIGKIRPSFQYNFSMPITDLISYNIGLGISCYRLNLYNDLRGMEKIFTRLDTYCNYC